MVGGQVVDLAAEGKVAGDGAAATVDDLEIDPPPQDRGAVPIAACGSALSAAQGERPSGPDRRTLRRAGRLRPVRSAWRSRSPTTCSTSRARSDQAGKRVGKDAARGKLTYPGLLGVEESRRRAERPGATRPRRASMPLGPAAGLLAELARYRDGKRSLSRTDRWIDSEESAMTAHSARGSTSPDRPARADRRPARAAGPGDPRRAGRACSSVRPAHFASNLGVVELCLALHLTFDFRQRPADLGHRPPDLSAQADHRPLPRSSTRSAPRAA